MPAEHLPLISDRSNQFDFSTRLVHFQCSLRRLSYWLLRSIGPILIFGYQRYNLFNPVSNGMGLLIQPLPSGCAQFSLLNMGLLILHELILLTFTKLNTTPPLVFIYSSKLSDHLQKYLFFICHMNYYILHIICYGKIGNII